MADFDAPPARRSRFLVVFGILVTAVVAALWVVGPYLTRDRDLTEAIDSVEVRTAARAACEEMRATIAGGAGFEEQNRAVETMLARIRAVGPEALAADVPAERWLEDWEALVRARREAGGPDYDVPRAGGVPIHRRMDELVKDMRPCQVPPELLPPR